MHKEALAEFLRRRREDLKPGEVGLDTGPRRRTKGLRREEVAYLASMSTDYYTRLEQRRGPQPSVQTAAALARALRLLPDERDHLFGLIGHNAPPRIRQSHEASPSLVRVLDRLVGVPALVLTDMSEVLAQNELSVALTRDQTVFTGLSRSVYYRWFTDPSERAFYPKEDHASLGRTHVARLRAALTAGSDSTLAVEIVEALMRCSTEFAAMWELQEVAQNYAVRKSFIHHELGRIDVDCETLFGENRAQALIVLTATPGTEGHAKLRLLDKLRHSTR